MIPKKKTGYSQKQLHGGLQEDSGDGGSRQGLLSPEEWMYLSWSRLVTYAQTFTGSFYMVFDGVLGSSIFSVAFPVGL